MDFIDLHVHSNASDGTLTPAEVVDAAITKELHAISLTDHDTIDGTYEALKTAAGTNLTIIPGIELSCYYKNREIHILGLFIDYTNEEFQHELINIKKARKDRNLEMVKRFQDAGINVTLEKLQAGNPNSVITRAHFARVLLEEGIVKTKDQAFNKYIGVHCPYYIPKPTITPEYALKLINNVGGIAILAHPLLYKLGYSEIEEMITTLIPLGLKGIEAYHSSNNWYESDKLRSLALKYNLLISGGSDFHGANKPDIKIGSGRGGLKIHRKILDNLKASLTSKES